MKKDKVKPAASSEPVSERAVPQAIEQLPMGQPVPPAEHLELPEVAEHGADMSGHQILAQEYQESVGYLGRNETTEQALAQKAERQGMKPDEVISAYLHEQLPRQDFYDQPVIIGV